MEVQSLFERLQMALLAQVSPIETYKGGYVTAKSALIVDEFSSMAGFIAVSLPDTDFLGETLLASKILLCDASFFSQSLLTANHASKVRIFALETLVESARGHS